MKKWIVLSVMIPMMLAATEVGAAQFRWTWTPPAVDVNHDIATTYIVQTSENGTVWVDAGSVTVPVFTKEVSPGETVYVRVAGVSSAGFTGPFTPASPVLEFRPPNTPGTPTWVQVVAAALLLLTGLFFWVRRDTKASE